VFARAPEYSNMFIWHLSPKRFDVYLQVRMEALLCRIPLPSTSAVNGRSGRRCVLCGRSLLTASNDENQAVRIFSGFEGQGEYWDELDLVRTGWVLYHQSEMGTSAAQEKMLGDIPA
jgi:hypothetical protein